MKLRQLSLLVGALLFAWLETSSAQVQLRPGQYEVTLEMDLPIPKDAQAAILDVAGFNKQKRLECITDQARNANELMKLYAREAEEANCKFSDVKAAGNKLTFTTTCEEDDVRMTMSTEMTFGPDSFSGVTKGKDDKGLVSTVKQTAKRVGECKK